MQHIEVLKATSNPEPPWVSATTWIYEIQGTLPALHFSNSKFPALNPAASVDPP